MREHEFSVVVNAPPHEVWEVFWYRAPDRPQSKLATIEILHPGDEVGEGLVRHCTFPVPKLLLSGGVGHSWEWLTQVRPYESWKYDAVGKPLWSKAEGWTRLEDLGDGRTRIHFRERYHAFNPVLRVLLERWVHRRISRDNDTILAGIEGGLRWMRRKNRQEAGNTLSPMANPIDDAVEGLTVPKIFLRRVASRPDEPAIRWKNPDGGDGWDEWTWREYADLVAKATGGLGRLGLRRGDRAVMMMRNVADFHVVDTALGFLGVCAISIYNSSSPEQVQYLTHHSEAKVAVVEDLSFLERFLKVRGELPQLERIVVLNDPDGLAPDDVLTRDDLFGGDAADLDELVDVARPEDLATIIYTSGTTGPPKGAPHDRSAHGGLASDLVPADGAHRRADDGSLQPHARRAGGLLLSRGEPDRRVHARRPTQPALRRAPRVGEGARRRDGSRRQRARRGAAQGDGGRARCGAQGRRAHGRRRAGAGRPGGAPRRSRCRRACPGARTRRTRRLQGGHHRCGADQHRGAVVLPRHRCAALGDLRHERVHGTDDLGPLRGQDRHRGAGDRRL
ncbi:MAG: hypothetical protein E6G17_13845 [Actinobacteria bacterium]|nr:MAG: hypothetical protein E6G17_13845 [Actinomycetota bacterium]